MHELTLVETLLTQVKQYQDRPIASITLEVGTMTCVDPDRLKFCFDMVKADADLAEAELKTVPHVASAKCNDCGQTFELQKMGQACECGSYRYTMLDGQELNLIEIEFNDV